MTNTKSFKLNCKKTHIDRTIPVIFSVDDNYAPFLGVTIRSIISNAAEGNNFIFHVLNTNLSELNKEMLTKECNGEAIIDFIDVNAKLKALEDKLFLRDYYTMTTYFRFFIPALFPNYEKVLYLDCDIALTDDVAKLYDTDLGGNLLGAIREEVMAAVPAFADYTEKVLNISRYQYFNAGILVMDLKKLREFDLENKFAKLLSERKFSVAQDQDYLNVLCKGRVTLVSVSWNKTPIKSLFIGKPALVHYKLHYKPWHYDKVMYGEYFWQYAKETAYYDMLQEMKANFSEHDKEKDALCYSNLVKLAEREASLVETSDEFFLGEVTTVI